MQRVVPFPRGDRFNSPEKLVVGGTNQDMRREAARLTGAGILSRICLTAVFWCISAAALITAVLVMWVRQHELVAPPAIPACGRSCASISQLLGGPRSLSPNDTLLKF